ncbi:MAG: hypothetical protein AVDCRST_MAG64-1671 [uncultured Phycisphaerae bacterium]|uniref:Uncharacterized protein n=1 Tax=uncultured Phycisphaerae bacterium TaxID=904963 RepID=A0A6J4P526_9BACT|nr:MAG: hypothetical protein AVDCRST_MAG64-1671 [uncultured Phycisphaerae bacterium]
MRKFLMTAFAVAGLTLAGANLRADDKAKDKEKEEGVAGILIDKKCGESKKTEDDAAMHGAACALKCADSGLGLVKGDKWIKLDEKGQKLAKEYLEKHKDDKDATKVHVTGKVNKEGDTIEATAIHSQSEKKKKDEKKDAK